MKDSLIFVLILFGMLLVGFLWGGLTYAIFLDDREINHVGLYISNTTKVGLEIITTENPKYRGDWICLDANDMSNYEYIVEVCSHEVAHKIYSDNVENYNHTDDEAFAQSCEDDITKCIGLDWDS